MFNNLFRSLSQQFKGGPGQTEAPGTSNNDQDRTEDGFLLVGDTASERTTVRGDRFHSNEIDAPPNYRELSEGQQLPSYSDYRSNINAYQSPTIDVSQHPYIAHGNPMQSGSTTISIAGACHAESTENHSTGSANSNRTAVSDIPFHLGCGIGGSSILQEIKTNNLLMQRTFDFSNYEYDFTTELSFLREHEVFEGEMAMDISS